MVKVNLLGYIIKVAKIGCKLTKNSSASYMVETVQGQFITTLDKYDADDMKELKNYL